MRSFAWNTGLTALVGLLALFLSPDLTAQQRLDLGVHVTPQALSMHSEERDGFREGNFVYTEGGSGVDVGISAGAYLEYEVVPGLSLRAGVDMVRKRYRYDVRQTRLDSVAGNSGLNRIVYMAMEIPVSVIYRFDYFRNNDRFLVGAGGVIGRFVGDPQAETAFYRGNSGGDNFEYRNYSLHVLAGYERYLSDRFVLGFEPYISYAPTPDRFHLETRTDAVSGLEAGLSVRLRFDN